VSTSAHTGNNKRVNVLAEYCTSDEFDQLACIHCRLQCVAILIALSHTVWRSNSFLSSIAVVPGIKYVLKVPTETCTPFLGCCASTEKTRRARRQTAAAELAMVIVIFKASWV